MPINITYRENTLEIFDTFYSVPLQVNAADWDSVYSYFVGVLKGNPESERTKQTASQYATTLFRIAQETGTNIQIFMDYFKTNVLTKLQVNTEMAFYLNLLKSKTALYGVSRVPTPNQAVQRNVLP
jgi:hypothetical protein|tara:strand:+ start:25646 stop:26023 length:378 start_codon:yes stop_codon:yes gene_type:complete